LGSRIASSTWKYRHVRVGVGQHRRLHEISGVTDPAAAGDNPRTLVPPGVEIAGDPPELLVRDQRANLSFGIEAVADLDLTGIVGDALHQPVDAQRQFALGQLGKRLLLEEDRGRPGVR
jgi:hypothetical protein